MGFVRIVLEELFSWYVFVKALALSSLPFILDLVVVDLLLLEDNLWSSYQSTGCRVTVGEWHVLFFVFSFFTE